MIVGMIFSIVILSISFVGVSPTASFSSQLSDMITYLTKKSSIDYQSYGCWCNALNLEEKNTVIDQTDRCCRFHYDCYKTVSSNCNKSSEYDFILRKESISCMDGYKTCEHAICLCDKLMAECLKRYLNTFNAQQFANLTHEQCLPERCLVGSTTIKSTPSNATVSNSTSSPIQCQPFERPSSYSNCTKARWNQQEITVAGNRTFASLMYPFGISFDRNDNLYVSESADNQVQKFYQGSLSGIKIAEGIRDIFIDSNDTLFILGSDKVPTRKLNLNTFQMETIISHECDPWSIYVNQNGDIYISEQFRNNHTGQVNKYSFDHDTIKKENIFITKDKEPSGILVDQCNTLYAAISSENGTIEKFYSGNSNSVIIVSNLSYPADVLLDKYGNLYFIQLGINSIRRINVRDGKIEVIINQIEKVTTEYPGYRDSWPMNIAFDSKFNLYVSDQDSHIVKMFSFQGRDLFC